jgi:hypothetical protein
VVLRKKSSEHDFWQVELRLLVGAFAFRIYEVCERCNRISQSVSHDIPVTVIDVVCVTRNNLVYFDNFRERELSRRRAHESFLHKYRMWRREHLNLIEPG